MLVSKHIYLRANRESLREEKNFPAAKDSIIDNILLFHEMGFMNRDIFNEI